MRNTRWKNRPAFLLALVSVWSVANGADASLDLDKETSYHMLLLDTTNSMVQKRWRWSTAIQATRSWLEFDYDTIKRRIVARNVPPPNTYGIWSFVDSDEQNGVAQLWPRTESDCDVVVRVSKNGTPRRRISLPFVQATGEFQGETLTFNYCVVDPSALEGMELGLAFAGIQNKVSALEHEVQFPASRTPLGRSLCDAVEYLRLTAEVAAASHSEIRPEDIRRTITVQTDGGASGAMTSHPCDGSRPDSDFIYDYTQDDWGLPENSWQLRATRRAFRSTQPTEQATEEPLKARATNVRPSFGNLTWRVGLMFEFCEPNPDYPTEPNPCECEANPFIAPTADNKSQWCLHEIGCSSNPDYDPSTDTGSDKPTCVPDSGYITPVDGRTLPDPLTLPNVSYPPPVYTGEFGFFSGLGDGNEESYFEPLGVHGNDSYGLRRRVPGDVNLDGCVDRQDYDLIVAEGVFDHRAYPGVSPQANIAADLDHDSWVTPKDRLIVLENLGRGCTDPDLVPDDLSNARLDLQVRELHSRRGSCGSGAITPQFKVTNWSDEPFPLNGINIRMVFDHDFEAPIEFVHADYVTSFDRRGWITGDYGQVTPLESEPPDDCDLGPDRRGSQTHHLQVESIFGGGAIPGNGGYAIVTAQYRRADGAWPFDADCDDFSKLTRSNYRRFRDDPHFALVEPSSAIPQTLICEFKGPHHTDPDSGIDPGISACGVNACDVDPSCLTDADCDDENECTVDECLGGSCSHGHATGGCSDDGRSCTDDICDGGICTHPDNGSCGGSCSGAAWSSSSTYRAGDEVVETCHVNFPGTPCYGHQGDTFVWRCDAPIWCNIEPGSNTAGWWVAWTPIASCE